MKQILKKPLVSIIVITYNSSKYVLETLESAKNQTYKNIELIIADDCSVDNTVDLCKDWLKINSQFFKDASIVVNKINKGIAGNCNTGINHSQGEWIKIIAGDDLLINTSIEDYINYGLENNFKLFFGYPEIILETKDEEYRQERERYYENTGDFFQLDAKSQFLHLLLSDVLPMNPATIFFNNVFLKSMGGFDENFIPEDFPLYLKTTYLGNQLGIMKKKTVIYRIHNSSLSFKGKSEGAINTYWFKIKKQIRSPYITWNLFLKEPLVIWEYYNILLWKELTLALGNEKKIWKTLRIVRILSPIYILNGFKKLNNKNQISNY